MSDFRSREANAFKEGLKDSERTQTRLLRELLANNAECEFGRAHGFDKISTLAEFRRAVPIGKYEQFSDRIDRAVAGESGVLTTAPVKRFFLTSGSTARPKYIPVTHEFIRAKSRAFGIYWSTVFENHPAAKAGRMVTNFSDSGAASRAPSGLPCSSESAYWAGVTRATSVGVPPIIPKSVARIDDFDGRYYAIARILLEEEFAVIMTLNPSTILLLFQKLGHFAERLIADVARGGIDKDIDVGEDVRAYAAQRFVGNPERAAALRRLLAADEWLAHRVWPSLALGICWRSPMLAPYLELLAPHFGPVAQRDYIMMASEGVMAIPLADGASGGPLAVGVHVYEFVPEDEIESSNPSALAPHELEVGRTYVLILTNGSGLWRYDIGDVIRVTGFVGQTPCIEFLHRTGATCSLTGEKLTEGQVTASVGETAAALGLQVKAFTVLPAQGGFPRYAVLMELLAEPQAGALAAAATRFDMALQAGNLEYASKRGSQRLGAPEIWLVVPGSYEAFRRRRIAAGTSDSQLKPTHLTRDPRFADAFEIAGRFHGN